MLALIWTVSLAFGAASLVVMAGLIVARAVSERRRAAAARRREALLERVVGSLSGEVPADAVVAALAADRALSAGLLIELFESVRGGDRMRLAGLAEEAGVVAGLRKALRRGRAQDRLAAAEALAWFPGPDTSAALEAALADHDREVRLAAGASLAELGAALPVEALLGGALGRANPSRRLEILLARLAPNRAADLARLLADEAQSHRLRVAILDALAAIGAGEAFGAALALAASPSVELRVASARALGRIGHPDAEPVIGAMLADPAWEVRSKAAETAGRLGLLSLADALCELLADESWWVSHRAGEALWSLGEHGIEALKRVAASGRAEPGEAVGAQPPRAGGIPPSDTLLAG